jgi:hypothetical protein
MYFLIEEQIGVAGPNPDRYCLGPWSGQELWRFDLYDESLEMVRKYRADEFVLSEKNDGNLTTLWIKQPPVQTSTGDKYFASIKDWDWEDEGHDLYLIYMISLFDGDYSFIGETSTWPQAVVMLGEGKAERELVYDHEHNFPIYECGAQKTKSDLAPDTLAVVNQAFEDPNLVREIPGTTYRVVGEIPPGSEVKILYGPRCEEEMFWWYVQSLDSSLFGWTAEGSGEEKWLIPINK